MTPEQVRKARAKTGETQAEFAVRIGVSIHAVRKWEQGQRHPGGAAAKVINKILKARI